MKYKIFSTTSQDRQYETRDELYNQAKNYENGIGVEKDEIKAYQIYRQLAEKGCVLSQYWLGFAYLNNLFCELYQENFSTKSLLPDIIEHLKQEYVIYDNYDAKYFLEKIYKCNIYNAKKFLLLAAEYEHVGAIFALGEMHIDDRYGMKNFAKAKKYFELAIKLKPDYSLAKFRLAEIYTVEDNVSNAIILYQEAADSDCAPAMYTLGIRYDHGEGIEKDNKLAVDLITKAANLGNPVAQYHLSMKYAVGEGVEQNSTQDILWCLRAAEGGHAEAQNIIALRYASGKGLKVDYTKAMMWYHKAAAQNLADAQFNLAQMYNNVHLITPDLNKAIKLYMKASAQGHIEAKHQLGVLYGSLSSSKYWMFNIDDEDRCFARLYLDESIKWFTEAALKGHVDSQYHLGVVYRSLALPLKNSSEAKDINLTKNYLEKSIKWYSEASEQDHILAQFELGMMYISGEIKIIPQNGIKAKQLLEKAAEQGHPAAQHKLAEMYENGHGELDQDPEMAYIWYKKANEHMDLNAGYMNMFKLVSMSVKNTSHIEQINQSTKNRTIFLEFNGNLVRPKLLI